jgi:hypothetical protein
MPVDSNVGMRMVMNPTALQQFANVVVDDVRLTPQFARDASSYWDYVIATFPEDDEPQIHGGGKDEANAKAFANYVNSTFRRSASDPVSLHRAVVCKRMSTPEPQWQSRSGQIVLLKHCQPKRKAI